MSEQQQPKEYLLITGEELLIVEHGCIHPDKDECIGKHCKYHDHNPSFRDNVVCLLNEHDVADRVRSRPHPAPSPRLNTQPKGCTCEDCQRFRKEECPYPGSNITMDRCNSFLIDIAEHDAAIARQAREGMLKIIKATDEGACPYNHCVGDGKNCRDCLVSWIETSLRTTIPQSEQQEQPR